jgi:hypothetical protein
MIHIANLSKINLSVIITTRFASLDGQITNYKHSRQISISQNMAISQPFIRSINSHVKDSPMDSSLTEALVTVNKIARNPQVNKG